MEGVTDEYLDLIDVLVDGPFIEAQKKITLNFRGSTNQRIIDLKETRKTGTIVLDPLNNGTWFCQNRLLYIVLAMYGSLFI